METVRSSDGTQVAFDRLGSGPAVILVGGALQYRSYDQRTTQLATLLCKHFEVFHYDRRGRGDSTEALPFAKEREIEDLAALIQEAGGSAQVFTMSSRFAIGLDAADSGLNITKLAMYEPPTIVDDSRPPYPDDFVNRLAKLASEGRRGEAVEYFLVYGVGIPAHFVAGMRQDPSWAGMELVAHTLAYDATFLADLAGGTSLPGDRWARVAIPTLVVDGADSPDWLHHSAEAVARTLRDAKRRTLEGQTHAYEPAALAPTLIGFFGGHRELS